ncbi:hypothetical protein DIRU0_E23926 [Diutina rugosa]
MSYTSIPKSPTPTTPNSEEPKTPERPTATYYRHNLRHAEHLDPTSTQSVPPQINISTTSVPSYMRSTQSSRQKVIPLVKSAKQPKAHP